MTTTSSNKPGRNTSASRLASGSRRTEAGTRQVASKNAPGSAPKGSPKGTARQATVSTAKKNGNDKSRDASRSVPSARTPAGRSAKAAAEGKGGSARKQPAATAAAGRRKSENGKTAIAACVQEEVGRYFEMLDGEKPSGLYRLVIRQAEQALLSMVMRECGGNQSRAAEWLGISRGNLRSKLADME